jgi:hypothetical protein
MIPPEDPRNAHWVNGAQNLLVAGMLFIALDPQVDEMDDYIRLASEVPEGDQGELFEEENAEEQEAE